MIVNNNKIEFCVEYVPIIYLIENIFKDVVEIEKVVEFSHRNGTIFYKLSLDCTNNVSNISFFIEIINTITGNYTEKKIVFISRGFFRDKVEEYHELTVNEYKDMLFDILDKIKNINDNNKIDLIDECLKIRNIIK